MWKRKKKANEQVTLIIIPATTAKPYSLRLPRQSARWGMAAAGMLILALLLIGIWFFTSRAELHSVKQLKNENQQKQETIDELEKQINKVEEQQKNLIKKQNEIKKQMGLQQESASDTSPSRGSEALKLQTVLGSESITGRTQHIAGQIAEQEKELDILLAKVKKQTAYYRSLPNQWPVYGEISSDYGWRKSPFRKRNESFHDGVDIKNNSGTPVVAAGDGIVIYSGWMAVYGKTIEIQHSCGLVTKYGHNSSLLVEKGETVKKGEVIAKLGTTGLSTGPHLHFAVLKGGAAQNPLIYLPEWEDPS